jgi:hypothetical protein
MKLETGDRLRAMAVSDDIYYKGAGRIAWQRQLARKARFKIYLQFVSDMRPTPDSTILDVGASDVETPESNILEKNYPYPAKITCGVIGDGTQLRVAHPEVKIARLFPGQSLPFPDQSFDIAYSNAVLEHVGGAGQRRFFISEILRVARSAFIVVPNGWFPLEHHTGIPFLHYAPKLFRGVVKYTPMKHWSRIENLDFITAATLAKEWPESPGPKIRHIGLQLGMFSSNIAAAARRSADARMP